MKNSIAICPGSFDPVTYGHLDIIERAANMFDKVIVVVADNAAKNYCFTPKERVEMIKKCIPNLENVEIEHYSGLLADYAAKHNATAIIKGLRLPLITTSKTGIERSSALSSFVNSSQSGYLS